MAQLTITQHRPITILGPKQNCCDFAIDSSMYFPVRQLYFVSNFTEMYSRRPNDVIAYWRKYVSIRLDEIMLTRWTGDRPLPTPTVMRVAAAYNMGDPLHNLTDLHTTLQHTTELHSSLCSIVSWIGCVRHPYWKNFSRPNQSESYRGWANTGPTSGLWANLHSCLGKLHISKPEHQLAARLCAARRCAAVFVQFGLVV